ncbi:MAG TPA: aspartate-semialdehyde dehydrogenase, partial [Flexistipes sinusarabici]|nr:aspartate-semialdehyde dehydrogenase [Flexistipes sinusarabici]
TKEEMKMYNETKKIIGDNNVLVSATCVRVPVLTAHSESIFVETKDKISVEKAKELFSNAKGLQVMDNP